MKKPSGTPRKIGYIRVSSAGQAAFGVSLEAQETKLREAGGVEIFKDAGLSGTRANRPGLEAALRAACEAPGSTLAVYSLSRLARSTRDALTIAGRLQKAGVSLVSLTEQINTGSAMGRCFFTMISAIAQLEADIASERTKAAHAVVRSQGRKLGGRVPYGFDVDAEGHLTRSADEQKAIRLMLTLKADGRSLNEIAAELRARGVRSRTKSLLWQKSTIRDVILRASA